MSQTKGYPMPHQCPTCRFDPFARNNYFDGKFMVARDFIAETQFHSEKMRHHEQRLHGWGVVCGLKVTPHPNEACRDHFLCIEPGTAIDCCGHEIIVRQPDCLDLTQFKEIKELIERNDKGIHRLLICIKFRECLTELVPVLYDECGCDETRCAPNRILESYEFEVALDPERQLPVQPPRPPDLKGIAAGSGAVGGGVAVVEVAPTPCAEILWRSLDGCGDCDTPNCVPLATVTFTPNAPIQENNINNQRRKLLPSTQVLTEVVQCLLRQGGGGLDGATIKLVNCGHEASAEVVVGPGSKRTLELIIPSACGQDLRHISAISWKHGGTIRGHDLIELGLQVEFDGPVKKTDLNADSIILLAAGMQKIRGPNLKSWFQIDLNISPVGENNSLATGVKIRPKLPSTKFAFSECRVLIKGDFIRDENDKALDADHLPPWFVQDTPPDYRTGDGVPGGTFESWFSLDTGAGTSIIIDRGTS